MSTARFAFSPATARGAKTMIHLGRMLGLRLPILTLTAAVAIAAPAAHDPIAVKGKVVLELPPGPDNPRNSEGAFITRKDGTILFIYSHFLGAEARDDAKARLCARIGDSQGEHWSEDRFLTTPEEETAMNVMSVSLVRLRNGDIGLFYLLRRSWHDMRMQLRRSVDEGLTWEPAVQCMPAAEQYVVNNDRVIRLASGRLVIPTALCPKLTDANTEAAIDWRGVDTFFLSDDDGRTWRESAGRVTLNNPHTETGLQEPGVVEMPDGTLWGWARTDLGRQYEFFSHDGGEHWTEPSASRFTSPASPLSLKRIPSSAEFLAVWNPAPHYETRRVRPTGGDRTPLVGALGEDADRWSRAFVIDGDDARDAGYCYTAIHFLPDGVLLAYCAGGPEDGTQLSRLRIKKLVLPTQR